MWPRLEQRKIHELNSAEQLCLARLEGQPHDCGVLIGPVPGKHYFLYLELQLHQLDQFFFTPPTAGQRVH